MPYYILYPKNRRRNVKIQTKRPRADYRVYGFAEGPLKTKESVRNRLRQMNKKIPKKFRS